MDVLTVVLVLLVVAAIWLVVEIVLTVRRVRPAVDAVQRAAEQAQPAISHLDELVEQAKPVVARLDEAIDEARPGVQRIDPVLRQTSEAIGALTGDLQRLDAILGDVSRISKTAGNATTAVGDAAESIASKARALFARGRTAGRAAVPAAGGTDVQPEPTYADVSDGVQAADVEPPVVAEDAGYFTYPERPAADEAAADAPQEGAAR